MALKQFENEFNSSDKVTPYFLDLIAHRDISNGIANRLGDASITTIDLIKEGKPFIMFRTASDIDAEELGTKSSKSIVLNGYRKLTNLM
jgi:hypothetical protein